MFVHPHRPVHITRFFSQAISVALSFVLIITSSTTAWGMKGRYDTEVNASRSVSRDIPLRTIYGSLPYRLSAAERDTYERGHPMGSSTSSGDESGAPQQPLLSEGPLPLSVGGDIPFDGASASGVSVQQVLTREWSTVDEQHNRDRQALTHKIAELYSEREFEKPVPHFSFRELPPLIGVVAGIPLSRIAAKKAGDSLILETYFVSATIIGEGLVAVWALDSLINEVWSRSKHKVCTHATVITFGIAASIPALYAVWSDNHNILYTSMFVTSELSASTLGFYKFAEKFGRFWTNRASDNDISWSMPRYDYTNISLSARKFFRYFLSQPDPDAYAERLLSESLPGLDPHNRTPVLVELLEFPCSMVKTGVKGIFYVPPFATLILKSFLSYRSISGYTSSWPVIAPYVAVTVLPMFALQLYTSSSTVDDLWGDTINKRSYHAKKSKISYYPTAIVSLAVSVGASMWGLQVVDTTFKGTALEPAILFFTVAVAMQMIILESHCIRDYFAKKYFHYKEVRGSHDEKAGTELITILGEVEELPTNKGYAWYNPIGWCANACTYVGKCRCLYRRIF